MIANGENAASGFGITPRLVEELLASGIEVLSGGNHIWDRKEILDFIPHEPRLLRPANFPKGSPGTRPLCGTARNGMPYAVLCLQGRIFMASNDDPFRVRRPGAGQASARGQSDHGGYSRRGHQREASHGLASSTDASPLVVARTRTWPRPTNASCQAAPPSSPTWA